MHRINKENMIGFICIIMAIIILVLTSTFPKRNSEFNIPGPAFFPNVLAIILILAGIYQILYGFIKKDIQNIDFKNLLSRFKAEEVINVYIILALMLIFIIFNEIIGFIPCTLFLLTITMKRLKVPIVSLIITTLTLTAVIIFLFQTIFHVTLPSGVLRFIGL